MALPLLAGCAHDAGPTASPGSAPRRIPELTPQERISGDDPHLPESLRTGPTRVQMSKICSDRDGKVYSVAPVKSAGADIDGIVSDAVRRWRFRPALVDGVPVKFCYVARFIFQVSYTPIREIPYGPEPIPAGAVDLPPDRRSPRRLSGENPAIPEALRVPGATYRVRAKVCIDAEGKVTLARIVEGREADLEAAVHDAVMQWRFEPYVETAVPKPACFSARFAFQVTPP